MDKKVILFDFDGVLAHTLEHAFEIHKTWNPLFLWEEFQKMGEGNFHDEYRKKMALGGHVNPENYPEEYRKKLAQMNLESELAELVTDLSLVYTLYIVSSTKTSYIQDFLEREKVLTHFTDVLGADVHESKVVKIKSILEREAVTPSQCLFITDTTGDIHEARECEVPAVCVSWGLHSRERLEKKNPFAVVDTPGELQATIGNFFAKI